MGAPVGLVPAGARLSETTNVGKLITPDGDIDTPLRLPPIVHDWSDLEWISMTDRRDAIRIYARLGLHPILVWGLTHDGVCLCHNGRSCDTPGKHPVESGWQKAPFDLARLDAALVRSPRLNLGLRMGRQPGGLSLITIDIDGGPEVIAPLEKQWGALPPTLTSKSARGTHRIFRVPDASIYKNRAKIAPQVDVRSEGGMIVAPPSLHASGATYRWLDCRAPEALP
jgi:putative DNA primase/helicase